MNGAAAKDEAMTFMPLSLHKKSERLRLGQLCFIGVAAILLLVAIVGTLGPWRQPQRFSMESAPPSLSHTELAAKSKGVLTNLEIGRMNLLCAQGLPGDGGTDPAVGLKQLDEWAARITAETTRHWYRFERTPAEFNHSGGYFRMLIMSVVLAEDFHVQYDSTMQTSQPGGAVSDGFFKSASSVFLFGVLSAERKGTCSSLPVLYVAIGRRLGYPLHLVTTKGHLFVRWEGRGERFNIEATSHGLNTFDDDYYRQWPFPITADEEVAEGYLKNLDSAGELAVFLSIRGMCLRENSQFAEAAEAFANAAKLDSGCRTYTLMHAELEREAQFQSNFGLTVNKKTSP